MTVKRKVIATACSIPVIISIVLSQVDEFKSTDGNALRFSRSAMEVMGNAEGCRREPYLCPARIRTQGIGHTGMAQRNKLVQQAVERVNPYFDR